MMRTYSGHSTATASNELYRTNLAKGQTGLSIAFDLPTQIGYDPDSPEAGGEVGKVGVPVAHLGHMAQLMDQIPVESMNTSMTINATAAWLLGLYIANAEDQGVDRALLSGTTQNDIIKEYLSRGTFIFPPLPSRRLTVDTIAYTVRHVPRWNPINVCSYHLQEAGATPHQEVAYALATAIGVLDAVRDSGQIPEDEFPSVVGRISFFVNAGVRFIEETCKMRAFTALWDRVCAERYGVSDPKLRRLRYGVQVNSLGLTEAQPENNVPRIVLESLGVTLSKRARARAMQLPAWNEALGLPRPWDQQWSLRIQQILAFESDLLEYGDIFDGSVVVEAKTKEVAEASWAELEDVLSLGGAFEAIDELKSRLVGSQAERVRRIETGELQVVGVNCFQATEPSPLTADTGTAVHRVDPAYARAVLADLAAWRARRDETAVRAALDLLRADAAREDVNLMSATLACARAGVTTGEWSLALRQEFGEYRAPTGISGAPVTVAGNADMRAEMAAVRAAAAGTAAEIGAGRLRLLLGKPGLDGHSNGAEQIAVRARDAGFEVIYQGIRLTPAQIAAAAVAEDVHCVGLSILSGGHTELVPDVLRRLRQSGAGDIPVVVGGIIPAADAEALRAEGVAAVFTPKDFEITAIISGIVDVIRRAHKLEPWPGRPGALAGATTEG